MPIFVNLNGNFSVRNIENNLQALIRAIASQFIDIGRNENCNNFSCCESDLLDHITNISNGRSVVLFIDELNRLGRPVDSEVSSFLKSNFLDSVGRYLVFSSHYVLNIDPDKHIQRLSDNFNNLKVDCNNPHPSNLSTANAEGYLTSFTGSNRDIDMVRMPKTINLEDLRKMSSECSTVTFGELLMYAGIPSLVFSSKIENEMSPRQRLKNVLCSSRFTMDPNNKLEMARIFMSELRTGIRIQTEDQFRMFDCFADHIVDFIEDSSGETVLSNIISWPLCYITGILNWLEYYGLEKILFQLEVYISTEESGKDWELITIAAIFFHSVEVLVNRKIGNNNNLFHGPFDIAMGKEVTNVEIKLCPDKNFNGFKDNFLMQQ